MKKIIFILILIQPFVHKVTLKFDFSFEIYNELISVLLFTLLCLKLINNKNLNWLILIYVLFSIYCLLVVFFRDNFFNGSIQLLIYSQFFIYYFYFSSFKKDKKIEIIYDLKQILNIVLIITASVALIEIFNPSVVKEFFGVASFERGLGGFYIISIFGSGPGLAGFLSIYIITWFFYHYSFQIKVKKRELVYIILAILLLILSFSRKEVLFGFIFLSLFPYSQNNKALIFIKRVIISSIIIFGLVFYYNIFFKEANTRAFSEDYVRWKIAKYSLQIQQDYFPFGSGVGTFGSRMSLNNDYIYDKYNMGKSITGYNDKRGPIYDAFLMTFSSEVGVGILLLAVFFIMLYYGKPLVKNKPNKFILKFTIFYLLFLSIFTPVLTTYFGYLVAILLGLMIEKVNISLINAK